MTEVMNRAARRAAKADRPRAARPSIETGIYVVPMHLVEGYYYTQIAREGIWNDDPPVIVHRPAEQMFRADDAWFRHTLSQMQAVRRPGTNRYVFPPEPDRNHEIDIDIGLIDVQIYFNAYAGRRGGSPLTDQNFQEADRLCGRQLHTQMVMATAVHWYRPDGSRTLHYHNLIFALRKQIDPDEHIGVIDLLPLIKTLGDGRPMKIIEEL
jgi:hypothetical protein